MEKKPAMPIVSFSTELGKHADYVDVDYWALSEHMTNMGFSDEEIATTEIHFDDRIEYKVASGYTMGSYAREEDLISVLPHKNIQHAQGLAEEYHESTHELTKEEYLHCIDTVLSRECSRTIAHELVHKRINLHDEDHEFINSERFDIFRRASMGALGRLALVGATVALARETSYEVTDTERTFFTTYTSAFIGGLGTLPLIPRTIRNISESLYDNDPEEIQCRAAEKAAPEGLVTMRAKYSQESVAERV